jgi:peptide/nickel transport system substrate-binding protein
VRYRAKALVVCALAVGLAASGCSKNAGNSGGGSGGPGPAAAPIIIDTKGEVPAPAPEIPGAKPGGTIFWLEDGAPEHLAPQQAYVSDSLQIEQLLFRHLTMYIEDPNNGPLKLVGDLATNTGETSDGGKTWTYHLRDGIKFEDGTPITAKDIAFGIAQSMGDGGAQGPQYLPNALNPKRDWTPDKGDVPPGVTVVDDKTIKFTFEQPHPEMPFLAAEPTSTPVPKAKYDGTRYEADFVASGPYMRDGVYDQTTKLTLKKNPYWDPKTDPIRHQYADKFVFDFNGGDRNQMTQRMIADQGDDQFALAYYNVANANISQVQGDPNLLKRTGSAATPYANFVDINTERVTDLKVRQALNYAFDRGAWITALGGSTAAAPGTTIMAPTLPGYKNYDAYPSADGHGDVDKAKALLAGQTPSLTYCFANTATQQQYAAVLQSALQRAGFKIGLNPIDRSSYYTTVGTRGTTCDLIRYGWGADYPDGQSTMDVLLNGKYLVPKGNQNDSYLNDPATNAALDALNLEPDRAKAATAYGELDQKVMTDLAPLIPTDYTRAFIMRGSKVWAFISPLYDNYNLVDAYVTG